MKPKTLERKHSYHPNRGSKTYNNNHYLFPLASQWYDGPSGATGSPVALAALSPPPPLYNSINYILVCYLSV